MALPRYPIVIIPARMNATRLPGKPMADIHGEPMIVHCWRRAMEADIGPVIVACGEKRIADAVEAAGGRAVLTDPDHPSGSDRAHEALEAIDPTAHHDAAINLQGDLPTIEPASVRAAFSPLLESDVDVGTIACRIDTEEERTDPNVVKAVISLAPGARMGRALYFSRAVVPAGAGDHYHHIGLYAFRRTAISRFVRMPRGPLEQREGLEQLRALEAGMRIDATIVGTVPLGVDTPADLDRARTMMAERLH